MRIDPWRKSHQVWVLYDLRGASCRFTEADYGASYGVSSRDFSGLNGIRPGSSALNVESNNNDKNVSSGNVWKP